MLDIVLFLRNTPELFPTKCGRRYANQLENIRALGRERFINTQVQVLVDSRYSTRKESFQSRKSLVCQLFPPDFNPVEAAATAARSGSFTGPNPRA